MGIHLLFPSFNNSSFKISDNYREETTIHIYFIVWEWERSNLERVLVGCSCITDLNIRYGRTIMSTCVNDAALPHGNQHSSCKLIKWIHCWWYLSSGPRNPSWEWLASMHLWCINCLDPSTALSITLSYHRFQLGLGLTLISFCNGKILILDCRA